jgi:hypothetical protein
VTAEPREVHPTAGLGEVVHQRARLGILTVLGEADRVDLPCLKSLLQLTDGNPGRTSRCWPPKGWCGSPRLRGPAAQDLGGDHQAGPGALPAEMDA